MILGDNFKIYCVCVCVCICVKGGGFRCCGEYGYEPGGTSAAAAQEPSTEYCRSWDQHYNRRQ